jgi:hypothetical protein
MQKRFKSYTSFSTHFLHNAAGAFIDISSDCYRFIAYRHLNVKRPYMNDLRSYSNALCSYGNALRSYSNALHSYGNDLCSYGND